MKAKRLLSILLALVMMLCTVPVTVFAADGDVAIDEVNFPDATFRAYVKENFDKDNNDILSEAEIAAVAKIDVHSRNITSLKGVEYFTSLAFLDCSDNQLTTLDVSKNTTLAFLRCGNNRLTELNISNNTALQYLFCGNNKLTSLDISNATDLLTDKNGVRLSNYVSDYIAHYFSAENNECTITIGEDRTFDLTTLPGGFDVSKAGWNGGTVNGNILTVNNGATKVSYTYDVGQGESVWFKLLVVMQPADEPVADVPAPEDLPFTDVPKDAPYYEAVAYLYDLGIMKGTSDTTFSPDFTLNRATVVTMLYRLEGEPEVAADATFTDVEADEWYTAAVYWAASEGIVEGYGDGTFGPKKNVTNEQLAAIIARYAKHKGIEMAETTELPADAVVSDWAVGNVAWAAATGVIDASQTQSATEYSNRAQVATSIYNYIVNLVK